MDIYTRDPLGLKEYLKQRDIGTRQVYPPIRTQTIYSEAKGDFPVADDYCSRGLWLPSSVDLKDEEIRGICSHVKDFVKELG